ncbi:hypothetical protein TNCT_559021 [Trichonephila clavata]|uniref:Uncharacterized protein n=1 Tax=Trichonephila clavata TaxID=2740835 RepID=A0A8X6H4E4_TRICU|nr:hypothetical protein TNCT_559021 [Trichonephila clavata]
MENRDKAQNVEMEDFDASDLTDLQLCAQLDAYHKQILIFTARKGYIKRMMDIETECSDDEDGTETKQKLDEENASIDEKIAVLEAKMLKILPCPVPQCRHNVKDKNNLKANPKQRPADQ